MAAKKPTKQSKAIDLAISALETVRHQRYVVGEAAYQKGIDLGFAINGHRNYVEYTAAIDFLREVKAKAEA